MDAEIMEAMAQFAIKTIIEDVKAGKYSSYRVSTDSGIGEASVKNIVSGKTKIENITFKTVFPLLVFYQEKYGPLQLPQATREKMQIL